VGMIEILLSGLIGAVVASGLMVIFTIFRDKNLERRKLAKERLEKVYGPLVALKQKIDLVNQSGDGFLLPSNPMEVEMVERIMFHYYYLLDNDMKGMLLLLHSDLRNDITNQLRFPDLMDKILKHYWENKRILGIK